MLTRIVLALVLTGFLHPARADDAEQAARVAKGLELAGKGQFATAIHDCYDPVIAYYERTYNDPNKHYFSARGTTEALLYALDGTKTQINTLVVSRSWVDAHFLKGFALYDEKQLDAARAEYEIALTLAPHNSQVRAELGNIYNGQKNSAKALEIYQRAADDVEFSPPEAQKIDRLHAYHGLGYAYVDLGQWDKAEEMYQKALAVDSNDQHATKELQYIKSHRDAQH